MRTSAFFTILLGNIVLFIGSATAVERHVPSVYSTIQEAINACSNGDVVIIAPGTYTGAGNRDIDFLGKAITVRSIDPNDPDVVAATVIDCEGTIGHRGFYFHSGEDGDSVVSGLTIKRGKIRGSPGTGGGIYCSGSSPTIKNCIITNNTAIGSGGSGDGSDGEGGGVYCTSDSHMTLINCDISDNTATGEAGEDKICGMSGCEGTLGEGGDGYGGGILISWDSSMTIVDCEITGNSANGGPGGTFYDLGEIVGGDNGGTANGGGIYCGGGLLIHDSVIGENRADGGNDGWDENSGNDGRGGGIYCDSSSAMIRNCIINNNDAAAVDNGYGHGGVAGGGIFCSSAATITNCTIIYNTAIDGDGIAGVGTTIITNCIVWGNGDDDLYGCAATYSCISDTGDSGTGVIHSDPCFVTGPGGDYYLSQIEAGQSFDSPCVDSGSDTAENSGLGEFTTRTDEAGDRDIVDMGYHYPANSADLDRDGDVDFVDFAILASQWLEAPGEPSADIAPPDGDGIVDMWDLDALADKWLLEAIALPASPPISIWKFDEGSGTIAHDSSGDNDGTLVNGPTWTTGHINSALSFDGVDDYVDLGNDSSLKPPLPVTISAWIKLDTLEVQNGILALDASFPTLYGIFFYVGQNNQLYIHYGDGGDGSSHRRSKVGTTALLADRWYHVAAVVRGPTDMDLYIDAVNDGGAYSGSGSDLAYSTGNSLIGAINFYYANWFHGIIDNVRVYDRALTAEEIEQLYEEGL
ncbi:MAG: hypothetical protein PHQ35_08025 [Phycisphaerae bacterium]|nr:hypothetical protein [Phycisphaerae bacterium]MDD5380109.1 hypothetical protein [Phycisphaerae bacterium]